MNSINVYGLFTKLSWPHKPITIEMNHVIGKLNDPNFSNRYVFTPNPFIVVNMPY